MKNYFFQIFSFSVNHQQFSMLIIFNFTFLIALIHFFVFTHVNQDDLLFPDDQFQGYAIGNIDGYRVQACKPAFEWMQPQ